MKISIAAISAVLVLCIAAFACAGAAQTYECSNPEQLYKALNVAGDGDLIKISADIDMATIAAKKDNKFEIRGPKSLTLDLMGWQISNVCFGVTNGANFKVMNGILQGNVDGLLSAFYVSESQLSLANLVVCDYCAYEKVFSGDQSGGGIHAYKSKINVDKCVFRNCIADASPLRAIRDFEGGAIYVYDSELRVSDSTIRDCLADDNGGGLYIEDSKCWLTDVTIMDCKADDNNGGGICIEEDSYVVANGVTIIGCQADDDGDDVYVEKGGKFEYSNCNFEHGVYWKN